jgi:hypothetical protein
VEYTGDDWAGLRSGRVAPSQLNSVEPAPGVVGMGGSALGLPAMFTGGVSGFSVGAIQRALTNWAEGGAWYEGVVQNAIVGAVGGAVAGGVVGAMNPDNLPAKVLVGGFVGGGVSAGTQVAFNVAGGRPWNEGVGTAFGMGFANGAIDAFTDYYGDMLVERAMTPRSARGAVDDVDGWRRPGDVDDAGSILFEPGEGKRWGNYGFDAEWHPKRLVPLDAPDGPRKVPSTGGRANEGRYRWAAGSVDAEGTKIGGQFAPGDEPDTPRVRVGASDTDAGIKTQLTSADTRNRTALLLGGGTEGEAYSSKIVKKFREMSPELDASYLAADQVLKMAEIYDRVLVNDISPSHLRNLQLQIESMMGKMPDNVHLFAADVNDLPFSRLSETDVFVIAPNEGLIGALPRGLDTVVGEGSRAFIITEPDLPLPESVVDSFKKYQWNESFTSTYDPASETVRGIQIDSLHFRRWADSRLYKLNEPDMMIVGR